MTILCCNCDKEYELKIYEGNVIACPHCGFQHDISFKPVDINKELVPLGRIRLGANDPPVLVASRLCTATRGNLGTGADDEDITNYNKANSIIVVAQLDEQKGPWNSTYTLQWRNVTDSGSFAPLSSSGECKWATDTDLVNGDPVTSKLCAANGNGSTWQNGEQVEGAATSDAINLADEYYTEVHFAVSLADALSGKQYEFRLIENAGSSAIGPLAAAITTAESTVIKVIDEVISIIEGNLNKTWVLMVVNETISIIEGLVRKAWSVKIINEVISIIESIIKKRNAAFVDDEFNDQSTAAFWTWDAGTSGTHDEI